LRLYLFEEGKVFLLQLGLPRRSELLKKRPIRLTEAKIEARQVAISTNQKGERIAGGAAIKARPDAIAACGP
jgi:hypothetical protein